MTDEQIVKALKEQQEAHNANMKQLADYCDSILAQNQKAFDVVITSILEGTGSEVNG